MSKKKKIPKILKIKNQEFHLSKGSSLFDNGRSKENVKEDVKWFRSRGFHARTKEVNGKHFLYVGEKKKKRKVGMVRKLMEEHERHTVETPQPTRDKRQSRFRLGSWICFGIGILLVGLLVGVGFLLRFLGEIGG